MTEGLVVQTSSIPMCRCVLGQDTYPKIAVHLQINVSTNFEQLTSLFMITVSF